MIYFRASGIVRKAAWCLNVSMSDTCFESLFNKINTEIACTSKWFKINKLYLNMTKYNSMPFCNKNIRKVKPSVKLYIDNILIKKFAETKFVGVIITENLTWDNHINTICNKVSKGTGIICKIRHLIPPSILFNLYFTLVNPYCQYCNIAWASNSFISFSKLSKMQKRAMRVIINSKLNAQTAHIFNNLRVLTLCNINKLQTGCFMFKFNNSLLPSNSIGMFLENITIYNHKTSNKLDFHVIPHSQNVREFCVKFMALSFGITYMHFRKTLITLIRFDLSVKVTCSYNRHCTLYIYFPTDFFFGFVTRLSI